MKNLKIKIAAVFAALGILSCSFAVPVMVVGAEEANELNTSILTEEIVQDDETPVEEETSENSGVLGGENVTLEDVLNEDLTNEEKLEILLDITDILAKEAGIQDEWKEVVQNLKTAASEKKIDIMTIASIVQISLFAVYIIYKLVMRRKNAATAKKTATDVAEIKETQNKEVKGLNGLIEEESRVATDVEKELYKTTAIAEAQAETNRALRALIQGTNIKAEYKTDALNSLNKADKKLEVAKK